MIGMAPLEDRAVVAVGGAEVVSFLQGLITKDIRRCAPGRAVYAALLTPQGKILFDFLIAVRNGGYLLDCAAEVRDTLIKRLTLYRLRAKVEIAARDDLAVLAAWGGAAQAPPDAFADPRLTALGLRAIAPRNEPQKHPDMRHADAYRAHRIGLGVPQGPADFGSDAIFALDAGLAELNGVDFDKGCYVGQELTARMKHRATARKRFLMVAGEAPLPAPGTPVMAGEREIGTMASSAGGRGLAHVRLDRYAEAQKDGTPFAADGRSLTLALPGWLKLSEHT